MFLKLPELLASDEGTIIVDELADT